MNPIESTVRRWQREGLRLLTPMDEAAIHARLMATGRKYSREVVDLYLATGGMCDDQDDSHFWSLWSLDRIVAENLRYPKPHLLFADFLIGSHLYCFKYQSSEISAVCIDYFNGQEPRIVSNSVHEFFDLYNRDSESLEMFN